MGRIFPNEKPETRLAIVVTMFFVLAIISPEVFRRFDEKPIQVKAATKIVDSYISPQPSATFVIKSFFQKVEDDSTNLSSDITNDTRLKVAPLTNFTFFKIRYLKSFQQAGWAEDKESYLVVSDIGLSAPHSFWTSGENHTIFTLSKKGNNWVIIDIKKY